MAVILVILLVTAWISDDAAITLKTVLNFNNGYGAVFNIGERVQAYTHPIWFALLSGLTFITQNVFTSTFILSISFTLMAVWILFNQTKNLYTLFAIFISLILSRSFMSFSGSGLENPLSHFFIALFILSLLHVYKTQKIHWSFSLLTGLAYLVRPDLVIITVPIWFIMLYRTREKEIKSFMKTFLAQALIGSSTAIIWTTISLIYYGSVFPNTAYAKAGAGIPRIDLLYSSYIYILDLIYRDPLTAIVILLGVFFGFRTPGVPRYLASSVALYVSYIVYIGSDFMSGRFFTVPFFISLFIIAYAVKFSSRTYALAFIALLTFVGATKIQYTLFLETEENYQPPKRIADERAFYYGMTNLVKVYKNYNESIQNWNYTGLEEVKYICGGLGFNSIVNGPNVFFIDQCALSDPLLSRLPGYMNNVLDMGHFYRQIPTGYIESIKTDENLIYETETKELYSHVRQITRGDIFSNEWWNSIWKINTEEFLSEGTIFKYQYENIPLDSSYMDEGFYAEKVFTLPDSAVNTALFFLSDNTVYTIEAKINGEYKLVEQIGEAVKGEFTSFILHDVNLNGCNDITDIRVRVLDGGPAYKMELLKVE